MKRKQIKITLLVLLAVIVIILLGSSYYFMSFALHRTWYTMVNYNHRYDSISTTYPEIKPWVDSLVNQHLIHDTMVTMQGNEQHHGIFIYAHKSTNKTAILLHGYTDSNASMMMIGHIYAQMGYNLLIPDHHAHGQSDGKWVQMGWNERHDVLKWMQIADSLFRDSTGHTQQVVHGISMGAALTMCVSGEQTPNYVKCFVEDCGYTSVWDEFAYKLKQLFNLPPFPLLYTTSALNKVCFGWSFGEACPLKQVSKCHKPMLFIHGDNDTYVPTQMVYSLYHGKPYPKQLWIAYGAKHARSYQKHKKEYIKVVKNFVEQYIK